MSSCLFFMHFKSKYYISLHVIFMPLQSTLSRLVSDSPLETYCRKPTASKSRTLKKHSEVEIKTFKRDFEITRSIKTALDFQEKQTSLTLASFFPSQTHWHSFCSFYFCSLTSLTAVDLTIHSVFFYLITSSIQQVPHSRLNDTISNICCFQKWRSADSTKKSFSSRRYIMKLETTCQWESERRSFPAGI